VSDQYGTVDGMDGTDPGSRLNPAGQCELTILMPCLNEAETLARCITKARAFLMRSGIIGEVLIADNGSTDGSQQIAEMQGARVVALSAKGYGNTLLGGIHAARGRYAVLDVREIFGIRAGFVPSAPHFAEMTRAITLEIGLIIGAALILLGLGLGIYAIITWGSVAFGALVSEQAMRVVIPSGTAILLGFHIAYGAFFVSVWGIDRK
jgi:glycosyltransferase involved in cell wall biosynthesis